MSILSTLIQATNRVLVLTQEGYKIEKFAAYSEDSRVLILGSFPSVKSRAAGFYYGNKQNRFWKTLEKIFSSKPLETIDEKIAFLLNHNIALYDVVSSSDLKTSSDSELVTSNKTLGDILPLLPPYTKVEKILCNGKTSYEILTKTLSTNIPIIYLPSTSPANPRFTFDAWQQELKFLI